MKALLKILAWLFKLLEPVPGGNAPGRPSATQWGDFGKGPKAEFNPDGSRNDDLYSDMLVSASIRAYRGEDIADRLIVEAVEALVWANRKWHHQLTTPQLCYAIATIGHECAFEAKNEKRARRDKQPLLWAQQERYWPTGYWGRGWAQLTWKDNYVKFGRILGLPLAENPDMVNEPKVAAQIIVVGMARGLFRKGHSLRRYINDTEKNWAGARAVYNGDIRENGPSIGAKAAEIWANFEQQEKDIFDL